MSGFDDLIPGGGASTNGFDDLIPKRNKGVLGDMGTSVKRGVEQIPGIAAGVADILPAAVFNARPFTKSFEALGKATGLEPGKWAEEAQKEYSPAHQQAQEEIGAVWADPNATWGQKLGQYATHPGYTANIVAESLPSTLAGGAAARGLMLAGRGAGTVGSLERTVGTKMAAPVAGGVGEGTIQAGSQMEHGKDLADQRRNAIAALGSGAVDAVIGIGAGRIAGKLGLETTETAMAKGFDKQVKSELSLGRRIGGGMVSEGILQELPQSAQEQVWQNFTEEKPLWDGVPRQAIEGMLAGFAMGGVANVRGGTAEQPVAQPPGTLSAAATITDTPQVTPEQYAAFTPEEIDAFKAQQAARQAVLRRDAEINYSMAEYQNEVAMRAEADRTAVELRRARAEFDAQPKQIGDSGVIFGADGLPQKTPAQVNLERAADAHAAAVYATRNAEEARRVAATVPHPNAAPGTLSAAVNVAASIKPTPTEVQNAETIRSDAGQVRQGSAGGQPGIQRGAVEGGSDLQQQASEAPGEQPTRAEAGSAAAVEGEVTTTSTYELQQIGATSGEWKTVQKYKTQAEADAALPKGAGWRINPPAVAQSGVDPIATLASRRVRIEEVAPGLVDKAKSGTGTSLEFAKAAAKFNTEPAVRDALLAVAADRKQATKPKPTEPKTPAKLSIGKTAIAAQPVTVRNGVIHIGEEPAVDYDSGDDIKIHETATPAEIKAALVHGGAIAKGLRVFGAGDSSKVMFNRATTPVTNPHTVKSALAAITAAGGKDIQSLLANGTVRVISSEQARHLISDEDAATATAFYSPVHGTSYFIADRIPQSYTPKEWRGLIKHEVAVHAFQLGRTTPEFMDILRQLDMMRRAGNAAVKAAYNNVPKETAAESVNEEALAYLVQHSPELGIIKRVIAWMRNALRALGWKTDLSVNDILAMAQTAMKRGVVAERSGDTLFQEQQQRFYSQLRLAVRDAPEKVFSNGKQTKAWLAANQSKLGVKKDELVWSGINEWLDTQGKITKADVLAYLDGNGVRVEEVTLGDDPSRESRIRELNKRTREISNWPNDPKTAKNKDYQAELDKVSAEWETLDAERKSTKFQSYQLPGGENYRELLLTLPVREGDEQRKALELKISTQKEVIRQAFSYADRNPELAVAMDIQRRVAETKLTELEDSLDSLGHRAPEFKSSHFTQPNILAHIRFNERTDADGKRVLFIEEIQSDWGQQGKKEGFVTELSPEKQTRLDDLRASLEAKRKTGEDVTKDPSWKEFEALDAERMKAQYRGIPNAPFVTDTKSWTALALKRMTVYAVENGFDKIAWTTGEQQAERYDLSKQVESIEYEDAGDGKFEVVVHDKSGKEIFNEDEIGLARIEEVLGKEIARKINAAEGEDSGGGYRNWKKLSGLDLKVGGEGMEGYYDQIVPQVVTGVLKQKVEDTVIAHQGVAGVWKYVGPNVSVHGIRDVAAKSNVSIGRQLKTIADMVLGGSSLSEAMEAEGSYSAAEALGGKLNDMPQEGVQQGFTITDELRTKVLGEGLPLFSKAPTHYGALTPDQLAAITNVVGKPKTLLERAQDFRTGWRKSLEQGVFDQYAPIREISMSGYIKARMSKGGDSTLEAVFMYGKPMLDKNGDIKVDFDAKNKGMNGFAATLAKLDGEHDRFLLWVASLRADSLKQIGLEKLWSHTDIAALKTLNRGNLQSGVGREAVYNEVLREMIAYNNAVLKIAEQRGLISAETRQMYERTPYVPFYRLTDEGAVNGFTAQAGMVNQYAWKKLQGGTGKLNEDLLANMLQNWSHLITASARNDAAKTTLEEAVRLGAAVEVPAGVPVKGTVAFREGDKERHFVINDPHLTDAITSLGAVVRVPKALRLFKHYLTMGVTVNPAFKIRNLMRDSIQSMALADMSYNPLANIKEGLKLTAKGSETRAQLMAAGGIIRFGSMLDGNTADMGRELVEKMGVPKDHILDDAGKIEKFWKHTIKPAFDTYQEMGDRGEQINRAALYDNLIKKGMSHGEAAFWARDLMDFSMSGKWTAIRFITQTVPFMNARLQGLYKLGRSTAADKKRVGVVVGGIIISSLMLLTMYHDDDDWKKREDWDRDNYWWFKVGGQAFYIPKPFELGAIGTLVERSAELIFDDEMTGKRFRETVLNTVNNQLSMNPIPQAVKPLIDLWANKDSFTGKPIETMGMDRLRPEDRYRQSTSGLAKTLSQLGMPNLTSLAMGNYEQMSPVQIDHLIRSYFSWIGTSATTMLDYGIFRPAMDKTERPAMQLQDVFLVGNFVRDLPAGSSRYVAQMYEQAKEIEQAYASYRAARMTGDTERAESLMASEGDKIAKYRKVEAIKRLESKWSAQARAVERSDLSAEEKRAKLTQIAIERDRLARQFK